MFGPNRRVTVQQGRRTYRFEFLFSVRMAQTGDTAQSDTQAESNHTGANNHRHHRRHRNQNQQSEANRDPVDPKLILQFGAKQIIRCVIGVMKRNSCKQTFVTALC